ncbi:DnaD domain protein [Atopobacter sp. AH10]|uniref:DnaD domain-containing protein n=1 Tax=Atopobacter sp. AH10 TaxID=2315861 RepID=UPI000EF1B0F4|nr:DnaD domain protein [Atopobacter sp. AH10]RLK63201.1 DnaD domain protein [Atopobacter sp. AH10]
MRNRDLVLSVPLVLPKSWLSYYHRLGLSSEAMMLYIHLYAHREGERSRVDIAKLARDMGIKSIDLFARIQELLDLEVILLKTEELGDGRQSDYYDISPFVDKVIALEEEDQAKLVEDKGQSLLREIEQEIRHSLSAKDIELVNDWLKVNKYPVEMVRLAVKETIINQANSLTYTDRILLNWEEKGLYRPEDIKRHLSIKNPVQSAELESKKEYPKVPLTKWLS